MTTLQKQFNLIEILISMVVIIFAMFIIISFIPLAQNQQSQAINQTHLSNFAQDIVNYIKSEPQDALNEDSTITNKNAQYQLISSFPDSKATFDTRRGNFSPTATLENGSTKIYPHSTDDSVFLIQSITNINGVDVKEAEIEARIWKTPSSFHYSTVRALDGASPTANTPHQSDQNYGEVSFTNTHINSSNAVYAEDTDQAIQTRTTRIMIEFSWPINRDYDDREKDFIFFDHQLLNR